MKLVASVASLAVGSALVVGCVGASVHQQTQIAHLIGGTARPATADSYSAFLVARFASLTNDPNRALEGYEAAFEAAPQQVELAERAVFAALMSGRFDDAVRLARRVERPDSGNSALVRLTLAVDAIDNRRLGQAAQLLEAEGFGPFNLAMATTLGAWVELHQQGLPAAKARLLSQVGSDPLLDSVLYATLGNMYLAEGEDDEALQVFEAIWQSRPRLALATEPHARLLASQGRSDEAIAMLAEFRESVGPNPAIDALRGDLEAGRPAGLKRPGLADGAALAIYAPAAALAARSGSDLSGVYFAMALSLNPDLDIARTLWAEALDRAGRRPDAIAVLEKVPPGSAFYATARGQMAWALRRENRNARALEVAGEALASTRDRDLMVQIGDLLTTLDRDGEAERVFGDVIALDVAAGMPDWRLYLARGAARDRLGRWPEAEADLRRALALSPDNASILNHLGYNLVDRGLQLEEGLRMVARAVDLEPSSGAIRDSLGWAYYQLGDFDRAVVHLERAVELAPADAVINEHLGDAYWRTGRRIEAHFQWRRALTLNPEPEAVSGLHDKLRAGLPSLAAGGVSPVAGETVGP